MNEKEHTEQPEPNKPQQPKPPERQPAAAPHSEQPGEPAPPVSTAPEQLAALEQKAADCDRLREQLLRARADFENYKKEARREREAARHAAVAHFAQDLLHVLDDIERALAHLGSEDQDDPLLQAFVLARDRLLKALADRGIRPIQTEGQLFDPAYHEAIAVERTDAAQPNAILEVTRRGYMMGDRVLRPSQVRVAARPEPPPPDQTRAGQ